MRYIDKIPSNSLIGSEDLLEATELVGRNVKTAFNWLVFKCKRGALYYVADTVIATHINKEQILRGFVKADHVVTIGDFDYMLELPDINLLESLSELIKGGVLLEEVLNPHQGVGSWMEDSQNNIFGYGELCNMMNISTLTLTKDYGWRPLLIKMDGNDGRKRI